MPTHHRNNRQAIAKSSAGVGAALCLFLALSLRAENPASAPAAPAAPAVPAAPVASAPSTVTDAQVVAAMQKGIDFLLSIKKGDNWEITYAADHRFFGGETGLALYALLHAGDSLQDDPDYHSKLHWRGKELGPVVQWLEKNPMGGTYATAMACSALTLLPKIPDEKPWEGAMPALENCKFYLLGSMRPDGGYTYDGRGESFQKLWQAYFDALVKGGNKADAKKDLDTAEKNLTHTYGGAILEFEKRVYDLRLQQQQTKDARELAKIAVELKELQKYMEQMPKPDDQAKILERYKTELTQLENHHGNPSGLQNADKKPMTKDELAAKIELDKKYIKNMEDVVVDHWEVAGDLSNTQNATLGAWAIADWGMELPNDYWKTQDRFWRKIQHPDGGWTYPISNPGETRDTMSVAGIASLFICQEFVDDGPPRLVPKEDKNIAAGLAWLDKEYTGKGNLYYMYGVERVGLNSGLKFFGTTDWYKTGAATVLKEQKPDGSWAGNWSPAVATSYALLFLARGRNPVVFNKLQYNGPWNARPRDDAYVTRWMSKRYEKPINWQVVNLQVSPDEWQDAPILLITGSVDPKLTKDDIAKIKAFINAGGMVFSTADGGTGAFTTAMKKYAGDVVDKKYEMRQLPHNHPLFSKDLSVELPNPPPLMGVSNGVREVWIHSMQDVGADWQMRKYASKSFELGSALYLYASGMSSLRSKLQPLAVAASSAQPAHTIDVALIDYAGNCNPEPGAWPRMAKLARANFKTQVNLTTVPIAGLDPQKTPFAYLTGTAANVFSPADIQALQAYLNGGGILFIDVAGGGPAFANSARALITALYPNNPLTPLPPNHPIYTGAFPDGAALGPIEFRKYGSQQLHRRVLAPDLQSVDIAGKTKILFSDWDIASGFLGTNTWGIIGYAPATSEALARNILLYSLNPVPAAPIAAEAKDSPAAK